MTAVSFGLAPTPPSIEEETTCPICFQEFLLPKVLACFHTFCKRCLLQHQGCEDRIICPICGDETPLTPQLGIDGLLNDYGLQNICERRNHMLLENISTYEDHSSIGYSRTSIIESPEMKPINDIADPEVQHIQIMVNEAVKKQEEVLESLRIIGETQNRLHAKHQNAISIVHDTCDLLIALVHETRQVLIKDFEAKFGAKQLALTVMNMDGQKFAKKMSQMIEFTRRLLNYSSPTEIMVSKPLIATRIESFLKFDVKFDANDHAIASLDIQPLSPEQCRSALFELFAQAGMNLSNIRWEAVSINDNFPPLTSITQMNSCKSLRRSISRRKNSTIIGTPNSYDHLKVNCVGAMLDTCVPSGGLSENGNKILINESVNNLSISADIDNQHSQSLSSLRSQSKRQKMMYNCKFGEFGVIEGQFTEPSGIAVNVQNDIVVADTNSHRIQIFDREGQFKFQFGECGKRDGQLLYPNRVSVNPVTGDFVITERAPTHQIQIYNQYGAFMRKFGADILQYPRGVCVDNQGRIIIVECKVMRIIIFDSLGNVLQKFSCSRYLKFPNGVCATSNNEILISDNLAHCIKVFSYEGQYLRQIGGEGVTNYPVGVGINSRGEVIVADNHNNFNLTIFDQQGNMLHAFESKAKHAQCFDMAILDDKSVVLASKDYCLYRYALPID